MRAESKSAKVLEHLQKNDSITSWEAIEKIWRYKTECYYLQSPQKSHH